MTEEGDGNANDDREPRPKGLVSDPNEPLRLSPEIIRLAAWSPQETKGLLQITTRLVKRRGLFWIETLLLGLLAAWVYESLPSLRVFTHPPVIEQPWTDEEE
jgi:hypothetical protein